MVSVRRHARHWHAYLACGGLVLGFWAHAATADWPGTLQPPTPSETERSNPPQQIAEEDTQKPNSDQRGTEKSPLVVKAILPPKSEKETAQDAEDRQEKTSSDWWLVRLTGLLVIVGSLQGYVFWIQAGRLKETIKKMDEIAGGQTRDMARSIAVMNRSADATKEVVEATDRAAVRLSRATDRTIETMDKATKMELRAYVFITGEIVQADGMGRIIQPPRQITNGFKFVAELHVTNTGKTPAYDLTTHGKMDIVHWPINEKELSRINLEEEVSRATFGSGVMANKLEISPNILSTTQQNALISGTLAIVVHGIIRYRDAFGENRTTKYRLFCGGPAGLRGVLLNAHHDGNEAD